MLAGDTVAQFFSAWYPLSHMSGTEPMINTAIPKGIYAALDRAGVRLDTATDEISAGAPTPKRPSRYASPRVSRS